MKRLINEIKRERIIIILLSDLPSLALMFLIGNETHY